MSKHAMKSSPKTTKPAIVHMTAEERNDLTADVTAKVLASMATKPPAPTTTAATGAPGGYYEPLAILTDARESLVKVTALAAWIHADPEANGDNDEHIVELNGEVVAVLQGLQLLRELLVKNGVTRLADQS